MGRDAALRAAPLMPVVGHHMSQPEPLAIAREALAVILGRFPDLRSVEERDPSKDLNVSIPMQAGLKYEVGLGLQNRDEWFFSVEHFYLEWFPCSDSDRRTAYVDAVTEFLSGRARILESYRGARCVAADLQMAIGNGWQSIGKWSHLSLPIPWQVTVREVRNA